MHIHSIKLLLLVTASSMIVACSSSSSSPPPLEDPIGDVSGDWNTAFTVLTTSNNECYDTIYDGVVVVQNDNALLITNDYGNGVTWNGSISASTVRFAGSTPYDPGDGVGTLSHNAVVTVAPDCNSFSGTTNWSFSQPGFSCNGTGSLDGDRSIKSGC